MRGACPALATFSNVKRSAREISTDDGSHPEFEESVSQVIKGYGAGTWEGCLKGVSSHGTQEAWALKQGLILGSGELRHGDNN